ncbi:MAG: glutathione peroxidase [Planctomycetes bacterium]|nr:glutathione peroxidase [Planctomycetota bacterium]
MASLHALTVQSLDGQSIDLARYRGKVLLVVNTASQCGLTPQYAGLQALYNELAPRGVEVLGFPSNDFGAQEPGTAAEIREFCTARYAVTFPLFAKVVTKGEAAQSPVYAALGKATGKLPGWNFAKYVVGKDGVPLRFFDSRVAPDDKGLRATLESALAAP